MKARIANYVPRAWVNNTHGSLTEPSGHVFRVDRARGPVWYANYRLPDGRQVQKKIGPAWSERGRPPQGYFTKRAAEAWLGEILDQARRGTLPARSSHATFADAAEEWLRFIAQDRERKPSTIRDYRSALNVHCCRHSVTANSSPSRSTRSRHGGGRWAVSRTGRRTSC